MAYDDITTAELAVFKVDVGGHLVDISPAIADVTPSVKRTTKNLARIGNNQSITVVGPPVWDWKLTFYGDPDVTEIFLDWMEAGDARTAELGPYGEAAGDMKLSGECRLADCSLPLKPEDGMTFTASLAFTGAGVSRSTYSDSASSSPSASASSSPSSSPSA